MILVSTEKIEEYTRKGWWGTTTLWGLFKQNLQLNPGAEAAVDPPNRADFAHGAPQRMTWAQLAEAVDRLCHLLLELGIRRDSVLLMQLPNCVEQFAVYMACARLGIIITPVPVQYRENELEHIVDTAQAEAVVTFTQIGRPGRSHAHASMFARMQSRHPQLRHILAWGGDPDTTFVDVGQETSAPLSPAQQERLAQAERSANVTANDVFTICWTSGTESQPKGVPRSHNEWLVVSGSIIDGGQIQHGERILNPFPLVNTAGISTALASWVVAGTTVVQHHPFDLSIFLQQLREERIDYTVASPAILNRLLQHPELLEGIDFTRLSRIGSGSAPLSEWVVRGFANKYGVQIINYFGSNEGASLTSNEIDLPDPALRAKYFPRPGIEGFDWSISTTRKMHSRLVDLETGDDINEAGRPGELRLIGPNIFSGYYRAPELTANAFDDKGYYRTGDIFEIGGDRLQYYHHVGRSKDLVIRGGMNISAEEIENLLLECPGVREVAVVGVPDPVMVEKVCVCITPQDGGTVTLDDVKNYLRNEKNVAVYKLPEYILLLETLPRNPVGKVLKNELRIQAKAKFAPTMERQS